jgi:L-ascorbate metabolism protein UlaG (beta-lactamase superfamily)
MLKIFKLMVVMGLSFTLTAAGQFQSDVLKTSGGDLEMFFIGHGTLMFKYNGLVIHVDPVSREADYAKMPDADIVLVTHEHGDHLDGKAIRQVLKEGTEVIFAQACAGREEDLGATVMRNGDKRTVKGIRIEALPAYNIVHKRPGGDPFHPKGAGNAYLLTFGDSRVLIGGDTENIPEQKALRDIDVAFLPMNLPYTMTPEMVADAAMAIRPAILYPYHFGDTDTDKLVQLLKNEKDIEVRIRDLQ